MEVGGEEVVERKSREGRTEERDVSDRLEFRMDGRWESESHGQAGQCSFVRSFQEEERRTTYKEEHQADLFLSLPFVRHKGSWTPTHGFLFDSLSPLVKIWGPAVIDLVAGALAVLLLKALHPRDLLLPDALLSSNGHQHQDLVRFEEEEDQQQRQEQVQEEPYRDDPSTPSQPRFLTLTNGLLLFLAFNLLPSFLPSPLPSPQPLSTHTPLSLACILPPSAPASSQTQSDLDRFLSETRRVASSARVLLWPEGAIQVENQASFEEAIKEVGVVSRGMGVWIGVGVVGRWRLDGEREEGEGKKKGNGMVLVGPTGEVVGGYRKVKVVPSELSHFISVFESEKN